MCNFIFLPVYVICSLFPSIAFIQTAKKSINETVLISKQPLFYYDLMYYISTLNKYLDANIFFNDSNLDGKIPFNIA